jgi:hypothetical protein
MAAIARIRTVTVVGAMPSFESHQVLAQVASMRSIQTALTGLNRMRMFYFIK